MAPGTDTRYCATCNMDVIAVLDRVMKPAAYLACVLMFLTGWVMMQVFIAIDTVVLIFSITICYWYICERNVMKSRKGTVSAVHVSSLGSQCPELADCSRVWFWLWNVSSFCLLMWKVIGKLTPLYIGSSAFLLHAGGIHFISQHRHQQSWKSMFVFYQFLKKY
jgi:hypothetical protein